MPDSDSIHVEAIEQFVPSEKAAPKVGTPPKHQPKIRNLAGDEGLARKVLTVCQNTFTRLIDQQGRDDLEESIREADQMYRMSAQRPDGKSKMKTVSNIREGMFAEKVDALHANEMTVLLQDDELPAKYDVFEQSVGNEFLDEDEARANAAARQQLAKHTWEADDRKKKTGDINWAVNKYGNAVVSCQWDKQVEKRKVRVITGRDENGIPTGFKFEEKEIVTKDCPTLKFHDFKNIWFDMTLDEIEDSPVVEHDPQLLNLLHSEQAQGRIMNVQKIKREHLYTHEPGDGNVKEDRYNAAGDEEPEEVANGLIDQFHYWVRLPIDEKGKWSADTLPVMCWCTFAGPYLSATAVCLRIVRIPYNHGGHSYRLIHSHRDDKGAIHDGLAEKLASLSWQAQTNLNQHVDNKDLLMRRPWTLQGQVLSGDLKFSSANKMLKLSFGSSLEQLQVGDTTNTTIPTDELLQQKANKIAQTSKPFLAEALGGRTSATESKNIHDAAVRPGLLKVDYFAEQLFVWLWKMDASLWEQFSDPKREVRILGTIVKPSELWGPFTIKVSAITEYANNSLERQTVGAFLGQNYSQFMQDMTPEQRRWLIEYATRKIMKIPMPKGLGGVPSSAEAEALARAEAFAILDGIQQAVLPEQNHPVHIKVHKAILKEAQLGVRVQPNEIVEANIPALEAHIFQHEQAMEQAQASQQAEAAGTPAELEGEVTGDVLSAQEGALANAG